MSEKFGWLFERRFGIRAFDYWYGYTTAQIELMVMDQPVMTYKKDKKSSKSLFGTKAEVDEMEQLTDAWEARHKESMVGKKINLGEFLRRDI